MSWRDRAASYLDSCTDSDRKCVADVLEAFEPPLAAEDAQGRFHRDLYAGYLFLGIPRARTVLSQALGIDPKMFSGSGVAIPSDGEYALARGREYLTPNLEETLPNVWTWELAPNEASYGRLLKDIILFELPSEASSDAPLTPEILAQIQETVSDPTATLPPVTRLGQIPRAYYTGKVTRAERVKAFFLDIRDGWNMTVLQAAEAAGFTLVPPEPPGDVVLYLWLFVPDTEESLVRATWGAIFQNLGQWLDG